MKYTIFGLQQEELIKQEMTVEDALVLERIIFISGIFSEERIGEKNYKWISYSLILDEIPIAANNVKKLQRILAKLEKREIIQRQFIRNNNKTKVFFNFNLEKLAPLTGQKCPVSAYRTKVSSSANRTKVSSESSGNTSGEKTSGKNPPAAAAPDNLYQRVMDHFVKKHGENYSNFGKEGKALSKLLSLVKNDEARLYRIVKRFYELTKSSDRYYSKLEFSPSKLLANYDNVVKLVREDLAYEEGR